MTIREFAKLNNFPIKGKLTRIPDEVEYDFNDRPHNCKRYVDEDFNELRFIILLLARWTCPNNRPTYPTQCASAG